MDVEVVVIFITGYPLCTFSDALLHVSKYDELYYS